MRALVRAQMLSWIFIAAVSTVASVGCIGGPIVECTGSATYGCPDGTCVIAPEQCKADPGCPAQFPGRCNDSYCTQDFNRCPVFGAEPAATDPVIKAPTPTPTPASTQLPSDA